MRLIISLLFSFFLTISFNTSVFAADVDKLRQDIKQLEGSTNPQDIETVQALQGTINWINDGEKAQVNADNYQKTIDEYPQITQELRAKLLEESHSVPTIPEKITIPELEQKIIQVSSQLMEQARLQQQEQDKSREISESLNLLPQQLSEARRLLSDATARLAAIGASNTPLAEAQNKLTQAEVTARKAMVNELEMAQLSANNRQEITRLRLELFKKRYQRLDVQLQQLRSLLNIKRQEVADLALEKTEMLAEQGGELPEFLTKQIETNRQLSQILNKQTQEMSELTEKQRLTTQQTQQVRQTLTTIREQAQWLSGSTALGEALRTQLARLPEMPHSQELDRDIVQLRVERLGYEEMLENLGKIQPPETADGSKLPEAQQYIFDSLIQARQELLNSLLSGYDSQILELTKLKVATTQLADALKETKDATNRYMFWVADISPIKLNYPVLLIKDITRLLSLDTFSQLGHAAVNMLKNQDTFIYLLVTLSIVGFSLRTRKHYNAFLERVSNRIGKVTQDHFSLTVRTVFWSILIALPLPLLWSAVGYGLQSVEWRYPMAGAIGYGVTAAAPVLWLFMISATFARPNGLFIAQFKWKESRVKKAMRFYQLSIFVIVPLMMSLITFEYYSDREFAPTVGRFCFLLLCIALSFITSSLKKAHVPLYLDKHGSGDNVINTILWWFLLVAPVLAALAAILGYLSTSIVLLGRLEMSVAIWFALLIIYHIIQRWMLIQRRKLAFERAKQKRAEILAQRAKGEDENTIVGSSGESTANLELEDQAIDLDAISAQSIGLVRSILTMIALVSMILLWSELNTAFSFVDNIRLWDVTSSVNGVNTIQPITMGSILVAILVIIITAQLVRNLPALLELAILQHLDLTPGTGYAITTLTKYSITLIGSIVGFSLLGIEWSKLQWLIAAMGVGLGFGLQEIFANIISGLMILFEKPIRIGDTVTIRNLTGNISKINTRATTLTDWDRKEIIVPNKAFITEQFINWSLSDSITRIVMTIPAPADCNSEQVTNVLLEASKRSTMILDNPAPEVYLVDLQQGIQIFELRVYAAEMGHRMPARHEIHQNILLAFAEHGIPLPFPPFQARVDMVGNTISTSMRATPREVGGL
ncbi:miniconductance mechanosensitive channel MscM [Proteus mirabilis]|uniref:miniconductance mechanosensitive channel MscM n=1 Tax=Proteus mirabilis TaxID=584 RepID=UPI001A18B43D|nr:miniconductance mechanosensitive channel MscM [Proteus mirabilis]MDF7293269.1 miniconductance mechanosensitive channel MscM [Proteus mirabilis]HAU5561236.1 miniconductance mechanosensitive channel MscM [Proteus mirabilis]